MRRRTLVILALALVAGLSLAIAALAQESKPAQFTVLSASYHGGTLSIVVKNEGDVAGKGKLLVHRELMRCLEQDNDYCKENPSEGCVAPCKKFETKDLGTETAEVPTVESCKEAKIEVKVPDEEAYAEIRVEPGSRLGFGIEINPRS
ncbi:MAG TPA: hypothetical protein VLV48_02490 [Thermoanaerobaculia bacterium]|nr:hypothetical protein [Thermoanaerobaculia bacterium]